MDKIKKAFKENPIQVIALTAGGVTVLTGLLNATAKIIEATAYAHRASKLK